MTVTVGLRRRFTAFCDLAFVSNHTSPSSTAYHIATRCGAAGCRHRREGGGAAAFDELRDLLIRHDDLGAFVLTHAEILSGRRRSDGHRDAIQRPVARGLVDEGRRAHREALLLNEGLPSDSPNGRPKRSLGFALATITPSAPPHAGRRAEASTSPLPWSRSAAPTRSTSSKTAPIAIAEFWIVFLGVESRLSRRRCYPTPSGSFFSAIIAKRQVHSRFRGATAVNYTQS